MGASRSDEAVEPEVAVGASFGALLDALKRTCLSAEQLAELRAWLEGIGWSCIALIEAGGSHRGCPRCGCARCHRCGMANDLQRYQCLRCRRTFNALTGTPLARLRHRDKWLPYLRCLLDSTTVRAAAEATGVHATTSFRWRHRFLAGIVKDRPAQLTGIVEADETYMLESQKGSRHMTRKPRRRGGRARLRGISRELECLLVARDRSGQTLDFHTGRGEPGKKELLACLKPVLAADVLLITDGALAYPPFARAAGIMHEAINVRSGEHARGTIHIQHVNSWHSRYKCWLARFHGIASRYLSNYSGWQRVLDAKARRTPESWLEAALGRDRDFHLP